MYSLLLKNKITFSILLLLRQYVIGIIRRKSGSSLSNKELEILKTLRKDGIVSVPSHYTPEECQVLIKEYDRLVEGHSILRPENERRIFGIERLSKSVENIFAKDALSKSVCEAYIGEKINLQCTMSARIDYKSGTKYGSGGSWHRDSFSRQIKSISYLTDMNDENGPFMYIKGSHKIFSIIKVLFRLKRRGLPANYSRYTNEDIEEVAKILKKEVSYFPCNAGTLFIADIRGLHTTRYLKGGYAYSIFNYFLGDFDDSDKSSIRSIADQCVLGSAKE